MAILEKFDIYKQYKWLSPYYQSIPDTGNNIWNIVKLIEDAILIYQSYFYRVKEWNEWELIFPYSRYLTITDTILNHETDETYSITKIEYMVYNKLDDTYTFRDKDSYTIRRYEYWCYAGQKVTISGSVAPEPTDRLEILPQKLGTVSNNLFSNLITIIPAYPDTHTELDTWKDLVTYQIVNRVPAEFGGNVAKSVQELNARLRATYKNKYDPTKVYQVFGQQFETLIQFDVWAKSASEADDLAGYFESFMKRYRWIMRRHGATQVLFNKQYRDKEVTRWRNDITNRSLLYYIRTEELETQTLHPFTNISLGSISVITDDRDRGSELPGHVEAVDEQGNTVLVPYQNLIS